MLTPGPPDAVRETRLSASQKQFFDENGLSDPEGLFRTMADRAAGGADRRALGRSRSGLSAGDRLPFDRATHVLSRSGRGCQKIALQAERRTSRRRGGP